MIRLLPLLALGCIKPIESDTDTTLPHDTHDTTPEAEVLVDQEQTMPYSGAADYVDFYVDHGSGDTWIHIALTSAEVGTLNGILISPSEGCALQVPYYSTYMVDREGEHENQGWVRLVEAGRHTLSVFGVPPLEGGQVRCLVETVPREADMPFQDADMACCLDDDACTCTSQCSCNMVPSEEAKGSGRVSQQAWITSSHAQRARRADIRSPGTGRR
jgi:hypothetical protein